MMTHETIYTATCKECDTTAVYTSKTAADNLVELHNRIHHTEA